MDSATSTYNNYYFHKCFNVYLINAIDGGKNK